MIKLRQKKLKNGDKSLYLDIIVNGKRSYEFLNLHLTRNKSANKETLELANNIMAKRQLEINSATHGFTPAFKKKYDFVQYFYDSMPENDRLYKKRYHSAYSHIQKYTKGSIQISQIDDVWIEGFLTHLLQTLTANSALKYLDYVKAILHKAVREKIIGTNPFVYFKTKVKLTEVKKDYLELKELQTLSKTKCNQENIKDAFLFSCFTGLRLSDTRNLTWDNIEGKQIKYTQKKTKSHEYLPISSTALEILKSYKQKRSDDDSTSTIFNLPSQQVVSVNLKKWSKDARINKPITFHIARHTFATLSLTYGTDLYTVSKLLGHTDIRHTQKYAKIIDQTKVKAVNNLPSLKIS